MASGASLMTGSLHTSQVTEVDTYLSSKSQISCGVPQGSVLGRCYS